MNLLKNTNFYSKWLSISAYILNKHLLIYNVET